MSTISLNYNKNTARTAGTVADGKQYIKHV